LKGRNGILLFSGIAVVFAVRTIVRNVDWKDNLSIYTAGVKSCPNSVKTHFNLGTTYLQMGNATAVLSEKKAYYTSAVSEFSTAKEIYLPYVNIYENLGFVYAELAKIGNNRNDSIAYYQKGKETLSYAIFELKLNKPSLFQNQFAILDQLILLTNDSEEKNALIDEMLRTVKQLKNPSSEDLKREIHYLIQRGRTNELKQPAERMGKKYPEDAGYLLLISEQFFKEGKFEVCLELMQAYCKGNPSDLNAQSNMGMVMEILGRNDEALALYEKILKQNPTQAHTLDLYTKLKAKNK
ncbi:MAG: hypothetical protein RL632_195, partial [Bacteroidota bacterium]